MGERARVCVHGCVCECEREKERGEDVVEWQISVLRLICDVILRATSSSPSSTDLPFLALSLSLTRSYAHTHALIRTHARSHTRTPTLIRTHPFSLLSLVENEAKQKYFLWLNFIELFLT